MSVRSAFDRVEGGPLVTTKAVIDDAPQEWVSTWARSVVGGPVDTEDSDAHGSTWRFTAAEGTTMAAMKTLLGRRLGSQCELHPGLPGQFQLRLPSRAAIWSSRCAHLATCTGMLGFLFLLAFLVWSWSFANPWSDGHREARRLLSLALNLKGAQVL